MAALQTDSLPLVLLTLGDDEDDFEALYEHLEVVDSEPNPTCQSLIVARQEVSKTLLRILAARVRRMPSVHLVRLGKSDESYSARTHQTGTFYVSLHDLEEE